jgi:hypothetical protein
LTSQGAPPGCVYMCITEEGNVLLLLLLLLVELGLGRR